MDTDSPRIKKLRLAFKKAILESIKDKESFKAILFTPPPRTSLSFLSNSEIIEQKQFTEEEKEEVVTKITEDIRAISYEAFKEKFDHKILEKLENLDKNNIKTTQRDIKSTEYIKEIFESHLVENKIELLTLIDGLMNEARERRNEIKKENEQLKAKYDEVKSKNDNHEKKYQSMVHKLENTIKEIK